MEIRNLNITNRTDRARLAGMSSTITTPERRGGSPPRRAQIPPEAVEHLNATEVVWLTPQEFSAKRELGWFHRSVLQKAADRNECGLKDARRERTRKIIGGREQIIWEYPLWLIRHYLGHGFDGSRPPGRRRRSQRQIKFCDDALVDRLAAMSGVTASHVLRDIERGDLNAVLHPTEDRVLFLDPENARRWLNRQVYRHRTR